MLRLYALEEHRPCPILTAVPNEHHYKISISIIPSGIYMGFRDWFKKKPEESEEPIRQIAVDLPELDKDALFEEAQSIFDSDDEEISETKVVEATPEYDSGDVDVEDLLDEEMNSNYDLNTVDESEYDDVLENAEIIGDLPSEVSFES